MLEHIVRAEGFLKRGEKPCDYEMQILRDRPRMQAICAGRIIPPYELEIQTTSACNLKCAHCFGRDYERIASHMTAGQLDILGKRIEEFAEGDFGIKIVKFCGTTGEPLVNPATLYGIRLFKEMGKEVIIYTNGLFLDRKTETQAYYETVAQADKINLSLDADCESTFRELKGAVGFERIMASLRNLVKIKQHKLVVSYVIGKQNYQGIVHATQRMKDVGADELWFRVDFTDTEGIAHLSQDIIESLKRAKELATHDFKVMSIYSEGNIMGDTSGFNSFGRKCFNSHFWACIGPNSHLYSCGHRTHGGVTSYGSLLEHSFRELWVSKQRKESIETLPDMHCKYCSPSSTRRNDFMTFLSQIKRSEREEICAAFAPDGDSRSPVGQAEGIIKTI